MQSNLKLGVNFKFQNLYKNINSRYCRSNHTKINKNLKSTTFIHTTTPIDSFKLYFIIDLYKFSKKEKSF